MAKYGAADLVMTSGERYTRTFLRQIEEVNQTWVGRSNRLQMKTPYGNQLLIELTAFLDIDPDDSLKLILDIPASFTKLMAPEGRWDIISTSIADSADATRLPVPSGRILVLQGPTDA